MIVWLILLLLTSSPEISRGYALDANGNGICVDKADEPVDPIYNYIAYSGQDKGDEVLSFLIGDDFRYDITLSKGNEVSQYKPYTDRLYTSEVEVILENGNVYIANVLMDNKGTETATDDTFESIW